MIWVPRTLWGVGLIVGSRVSGLGGQGLSRCRKNQSRSHRILSRGLMSSKFRYCNVALDP